MKFYYIDDSMFQNSEFANEILFRFERLLTLNLANMIFISSSLQLNEEIERFRKTFEHISVIINPSLFDMEGIRGNLHSTFLAIEDYPIMQSFSGSCVEYDDQTKTCKRIYLELFHQHDEDFDSIIQELEQLLSEKISNMKRKTSIH